MIPSSQSIDRAPDGVGVALPCNPALSLPALGLVSSGDVVIAFTLSVVACRCAYEMPGSVRRSVRAPARSKPTRRCGGRTVEVTVGG